LQALDLRFRVQSDIRARSAPLNRGGSSVCSSG
jgi:hypothetical protein